MYYERRAAGRKRPRTSPWGWVARACTIYFRGAAQKHSVCCAQIYRTQILLKHLLGASERHRRRAAWSGELARPISRLYRSLSAGTIWAIASAVISSFSSSSLHSSPPLQPTRGRVGTTVQETLVLGPAMTTLRGHHRLRRENHLAPHRDRLRTFRHCLRHHLGGHRRSHRRSHRARHRRQLCHLHRRPRLFHWHLCHPMHRRRPSRLRGRLGTTTSPCTQMRRRAPGTGSLCSALPS